MSDSGVFKNLRQTVNEDEIISGEKFLSFANRTNGVDYWKRDFLYASGTWRGAHVKSAVAQLNSLRGTTLIVGHSDISTTWFDSRIMQIAGIAGIFAVNAKSQSERIVALPLGITNDCDDSPVHRILGDENHFLVADDIAFTNSDFRGSIYVNFTSENKKSIRNPLLTLVEKNRKLFDFKVEKPEFSHKGRISYLQNLRKADLVLCPEGNGADTHRFWETIYMGGIPVVVKSSSMDTFYKELPVVRLNSWSDLLIKEKVEELWHHARSKNYNFDLLNRSFWESKILQVSQLWKST